MKKISINILAFIFLLIPVVTHADSKENNIVNIYLFHSSTCSHCQEEIYFLEKVEKNYPNVKVYKFEIKEENNLPKLKIAEDIYKQSIIKVPVTIIGEKVYKGYSKKQSPAKIISTINYYSIYGYQDELGEKIVSAKLENIELPEPPINKTNEDIDKYIETNSQYNILFNIKSNDLDIETSSTLLGLKNSLNIINIFLIIIIIIVTNELNKYHHKLIVYIIFSITTTFFEILNYLSLKTTNIIIIYIILSIIIIIAEKFKAPSLNQFKKEYILTFNITGIFLIVRKITGINEITKFQKIIKLNVLTISEQTLNLISYVLSINIMNIAIMITITLLLNSIKTKLKSKHNDKE